YTLCVGPGQVTVPPVIGLPKGDAQNLLKQVKLNPTTVEVDSDKPAGQVVGSNPAQGSTVNEGSTVTLQISKGNQKLLPDLTGKTQSDAAAALAQAGFNDVSYVPQNSSPENAGRVVSQNPPGNKAYLTSTKITVFIGKSVAPTTPATPTPTPTSTQTP